MPTEERLEALIEQDPGILGDRLMIIGRQVRTDFGGRIDLLAIDADGNLQVLELKKDKTPRDVVAQALDYGLWVKSLSNDAVRKLFDEYSKVSQSFDVAYETTFGFAPPEDINSAHQLTVVAAEIDAATERIIEYLAAYTVPINVLFFRYFEDGDRQYLARTLLLDREQTATAPSTGAANGTKEPWNGIDWYVSFGETSDGRSWNDAAEYGFVSAGGGEWFSRTLRNLPGGPGLCLHPEGRLCRRRSRHRTCHAVRQSRPDRRRDRATVHRSAKGGQLHSSQRRTGMGRAGGMDCDLAP